MWEFVFYIKRGGKYRNDWDLKGFTNNYITGNLILLSSIGLRWYTFSVLVKILGHIGHVTGRCLVKSSEEPTAIVGTHDTTFTLCSVRPHYFFKFKCTHQILRRYTYVLFKPSQLSWEHNPFLMLRCFVRNASLFLRRVQLCCYKNLFKNQMRGPPNLTFCATQRCLFGRELSVRKKVSLPVEQSTLSHASLWGKKRMWWRLANPCTTYN